MKQMLLNHWQLLLCIATLCGLTLYSGKINENRNKTYNNRIVECIKSGYSAIDCTYIVKESL